MSKFKVGQQVRVVVDDSVVGLEDSPVRGSIGTVIRNWEENETAVEFDDWDTSPGPFFYTDDELEAVE